MAAPDDGRHDLDDEDRAGRHWLGLVVPTLTFLVGLGLGGVLVYANSGGDAADQPTATPSEAPAEPGDEGPGDTVVTLPAACEEASGGITEAYRLLRQAVDQVRDFDAGELVSTLDELQTVDEETRPLVEECSAVQVDTSPTADPDAEPSQEPAEEPSAP